MTGIPLQGSSSFHEDLVLELEEKVSGNKMIHASSLCQMQSTLNEGNKVTLMSLHDDVFQEILSCLPYDEIAKLRLVSGIQMLFLQTLANEHYIVVGKSPFQ